MVRPSLRGRALLRGSGVLLPVLLTVLVCGSGCSSEPDSPAHSSGPLALRDLRRLTRAQYNNTVRDLLGIETTVAQTFPSDEKAGPFPANSESPVAVIHANRFQDAAENVAKEAVADLARLLPCEPSGGEACARTFLLEFAPRAYRRPVAEEEIADLLQVYRTGVEVGGFEQGIELVLTAMLQAPSFLYLVETKRGNPTEATPLDGYELASRLSYFFWNTMPDEALFEAARTGQLDTEAGIREQASRMLEDDRAAESIGTFVYHWLALEPLDTVAKNPKRYLRFDDAARGAMRRETKRFADYVIRKGDGTLHTLLTAQFSFLEEPLFPIYGMSVPSDFDPAKPTGLLPSQRAGILTHPSVMTAHSHFDDTSPVKRGNFVLENVLCYHIPLPAFPVPPIEDPVPGQSLRQRFEAHTSIEGCATCHKIIDPIGFGFESYDPIGGYRTTDEFGNPVDNAGNLAIGEADIDGAFTGPLELVDRLVRSHHLQDCLVQQWHTFALGREPLAIDTPVLLALREEFIASNYNIRELILSLVTKESFRFHPALAE